MFRILKKIIAIVDKESTYNLLKKGLIVGEHFHRMNDVWIDPGYAHLITIGNNVTLAPRSTVLAHDSSLYPFMGVSKVGRVSIGNRVFVGACAVICPGVRIGDDVIIGAGSVVRNNVENDSLIMGNPANYIMKCSDYINHNQEMINNGGICLDSNVFYGKISDDAKLEMKRILGDKKGYMV